MVTSNHIDTASQKTDCKTTSMYICHQHLFLNFLWLKQLGPTCVIVLSVLLPTTALFNFSVTQKEETMPMQADNGSIHVYGMGVISFGLQDPAWSGLLHPAPSQANGRHRGHWNASETLTLLQPHQLSGETTLKDIWTRTWLEVCRHADTLRHNAAPVINGSPALNTS